MGLTEGDPRPQSIHNLRFLQGFKSTSATMKRNATAITQNPYINLVDTDNDKEDDNIEPR